ncbi:zinc-binding alcohol dehydrogenase [Nocardioides marmoriginsengisoli]|uniref:Zinc-binding alcohol dehydrogenase n=2 Tax=Nocardioides marmoriginsengisoli TaxID=661483 RepID=A0A3N0CH02_9ACTN|nr:zinc-binding alcohol dehydrogenase [Nocardioides marmoriginsengisoli]
METVVMQNGTLTVTTVPIPTPGPREVLVKVLAAGICGSDLHCLAHASELLSSTKAATGIDLFDINDPVVMGHEFCAEVVSYGPETRGTITPGTRVASPPLLLRERPILIGYGGPDIPGAYSEYMILSEDLLFPVPDSISDENAALAEPLAVALHAVNRGKLGTHDVPLVIGCGPIGLAVISILKMQGTGPIVAADFSPSRRAMAEALGADVVVDPRVTSPYDAWREVAATDDPEQMAPGNLMFPPGFRPAVVFECVGVPGVIQQILDGAPANATVVVAGVCMQQDSFYPTFAILKEIDLVFSIAFSPEEYGEVLGHLASGALKVDGLVTSRVGLNEVADAFKRLADPEQDGKIVAIPGRH